MSEASVATCASFRRRARDGAINHYAFRGGEGIDEPLRHFCNWLGVVGGLTKTSIAVRCSAAWKASKRCEAVRRGERLWAVSAC